MEAPENLRDLALYLEEAFEHSPAIGAVVGRTAFRDSLAEKLGCSQLEAELTVDRLVASKHLVFERGDGGPGVWHVRTDAQITR